MNELSGNLFLTTLAIVDDLGALLVIAVFYTSEISWLSLGTGLGFLAILVDANWVGIRSPLVCGLVGIGGGYSWPSCFREFTLRLQTSCRP